MDERRRRLCVLNEHAPDEATDKKRRQRLPRSVTSLWRIFRLLLELILPSSAQQQTTLRTARSTRSCLLLLLIISSRNSPSGQARAAFVSSSFATSHMAQTQQPTCNHAFCFLHRGRQHPCVITSFCRPERPTNQRIRQYVKLQQQAVSSSDSESDSDPQETFLASTNEATTSSRTVLSPKRTKGAAVSTKRKQINSKTKSPERAALKGATAPSKQKRQQSASQSPSSLANAKRINQSLVACDDASQIFKLLQDLPGALTQPAGGGVLNSVNFSTALHRVARHSLSHPTKRAAVLQDARFALLVAALAEALDDRNNNNNRVVFVSREVANIGWALAKLKLPPPTHVMPAAVWRNDDKDNNDTASSLSGMARVVRQAVLQTATQRQQQQQGSGHSSSTTFVDSSTWIPALSQLAGHILDDIGNKVVAMTMASSENNNSLNASQQFQMQEYANLLWAWATVDRADPVVMERVLQCMIRRQKNNIALAITNSAADSMLQPQEWSNSLWAIAKARIYHGHEDLLDLLAHLLGTYPDFLDKFKAQEISNMVWGAATLLVNKPEPLTNGEQRAALTIVRSAAQYVLRKDTGSFKTQELANTVWSMATLGYGLTTSAEQNLNNNYVVLESDDPAGDAEIMKKVLNKIVQASLPLLPRFQSQELNNLAWSLARLVDVKTDSIDAVLDGIGRQLQHPKRRVTSQDVGTTLWSLATLQHVDEDLYRGLASLLISQQAHTYKPQELSNAVWSFATAEVDLRDRDAFDTSLVPESQRPSVRDPATASFAIAAQELMRRPHQFKPQEIKDVLWSFSKVGIRHPALFQSVAQHLVGDESDSNGDVSSRARGLNEFSSQGLGNMAYAFALQAQLSKDVFERMKGASNLVNSNGRLAVYTTASIDIGERLLQRFFSAIGKSFTNLVQKATPQDLANTAWAFAVLGLKDVRFMEATKSEVLERRARCVRGEVGNALFNGQEVANFLWSHAALNMPGRDLVVGLAPYICSLCQDRKGGLVTVSSISRVFKRRELANVAWACAVFGEYPPELMNVLYMGLVGPSGMDQSPATLSEIYSDQGLQSQAIMSLIYVQAVLDLAGSNQHLSLPDNFPDGWKQLAPPQHDDHMTDTFDELRLNTSKVQRAVSDAFSRIGFKHIEEHVITMEEMSREHGIRLSPKPIEILSIDIANIRDKIAIEVDGPAHFISRIDECTASSAGYSKRINGKMEYHFDWNGDQQETNGATSLKDRLLNSLGWKVINIPFWKWYEMGGDKAAEEDYCRGLLVQNHS